MHAFSSIEPPSCSIKKLFSDWKNQHLSESNNEYEKYQNKSKSNRIPKGAFIPDGIIDATQFSQKKALGCSVLFIAKEANWYSDNNTEAEDSSTLQEQPFWHKEVAFGETAETMFSKRLSLLINAYYNDNYALVNKDHKNLQSCAVINLNKRGGFSDCCWETLEGYVSRYHENIEKEISIINPDLIICCGNSVKWLLDKYVQIDRNIKIATVYHPSYFALPDTEYLNQFECALAGKEWTFEKKTNKNTDFVPPTKKGIIFDTNKAYSETATLHMLTSDKISAYDNAGKYIDSFNVGDVVFYYISGRGVVAAGEICSDTQICDSNPEEKYKTVRLLVPKSIPKTESELKNIWPSEIKTLFGHNFFWATTMKRPFLNEEQSNRLIEELEKLYQ